MLGRRNRGKKEEFGVMRKEKGTEEDRCAGDQQKVIQMSAAKVKDQIKRRKTRKPAAGRKGG